MILTIRDHTYDVVRSPCGDLEKAEILASRWQNRIEDMIDTCLDADGVGLAANQVGYPKRLFIYRHPGTNLFEVVANPVVVKKSGKVTNHGEGCLSCPDYVRDIKRYKKMTIEGWDRNGEPITFESKSKRVSFCWQHEIDHLNGITIKDVKFSRR